MNRCRESQKNGEVYVSIRNKTALSKGGPFPKRLWKNHREEKQKMNLNNIPKELTEKKQWVVWKDSKKIPHNPKGFMARVDDPETWSTYDEAVESCIMGDSKGVGFVFTKDDPYCGVDLDKVRNPKTGEIKKEALEIIKALNSYTEISQSGQGFHILVKGQLPGERKRKGFYENYNHGRYFALTGELLEKTSPGIKERQKELNQVYYNIWPKKSKKKKPKTRSLDLSDREIIRIAESAANGSKFKELYRQGNIEGYPSPSEARLALCNMLAFYTQDPGQIDSLVRASALYAEKWDRTGSGTIKKAIEGLTETYKPPQRSTPEEDFKKEDTSIGSSVGEYLKKNFREDLKKALSYSDRKTGYENLDRELGCLYPGLYVLGGISSVGKTTFIHQMADQLARSGEHVLFFSLEQSQFELVSKSIARIIATKEEERNCITSAQIRKGVSGLKVTEAIKDYSGYAGRLTVIEGNFDVSVLKLRSMVEGYAQENKCKPIVIVDYLQILPGDPRQSDKQRIDSNVTGLKRLSRDLDIPVIVISSLNRGNYLAPIDFEAFKESGGIEYSADVVWGLQLSCMNEEVFIKSKKIIEKRERLKKAKDETPRSIELVCLKNRNGKPYFTCEFKYKPRFDLYEPKHVPQAPKDEFKPEQQRL